jgi:hypothetical protein
MQYIQFQAQNPSEIPASPSGSLNLFLDSNDNIVKTKNENGVINGSSYITGGTYSQGSITFSDNLGGQFTVTGFTTQDNMTEVTYSELVDKITGNTLTPGSHYIITDFQTCYDVPEYNVFGNPKGMGSIDYRQGNNEPIIVLATSGNTISSTAYQPSYPNDRIQYDWTWNTTEITDGVAYGRITERIDEFNNRTDYDHRNISFNRFKSYNRDVKLTGYLDSYNSGTGIIIGNGTLFLSEDFEGEILSFDYQNGQIGVKVISASTDTQLTVVVDPSFGSAINFTGELIDLYMLTPTPTDNYNDYKEVYIGQKNEGDWDDVITFNLNGSSVHNYVGDYSRFYLNEVGSTSGFLLANNVFFSNNSPTYSNTIGDRSYNNTSRNWFVRNKISSRFYNNVNFHYGFYSNEIGEYFNNNIIKSQMWGNKIGEGYEGNVIYSQFYDNQISNGFYQNEIYSEFYDNQISFYFESNDIGDIGNLDNFSFYRNKIGNNFNDNTIRQTFQNNQIGNQFESNIVNGKFYKNVIGNGFNDNYNIGYNFYGNHIGNGFNNNELIGDYFYDNKIGEYFDSNSISYEFNSNQIGNLFENNTLGDTQYFNWDNTSIENLTGRSYNTFYNSLYGNNGENIGNIILGKELIMHFYRNSGTTQSIGTLVVGETYEITDVAFGGGNFNNVAEVIDGTINEVGCVFIATGTTPSSWCGITVTELTVYDEYHKIKFTQWTQNNNGGGFSYERTKVYPSVESTVYFTKLNYGSEIDVIIPSRLEIKRNNNDGIYNNVLEEDFNSNVSPEGTEWNSIYTQPYNGNSFEDNTIVNEFKGNYVRGDFQINTIGSYVGNNQFSGDTYDNNIGYYTYANDFLGYMAGNTWEGYFYENAIGDDFNGNSFYDGIYDNTIGNNFFGNNIGNGFNNNTIGDGFQTNQIGNYFNNNTIGEGFGYGAAAPQGNKIGNNFYNNTVGEYFYNNSIPDNFTDNTIGNYFQWNVINTDINNTDFAINYGNITGFSYTSSGTGATNTVYTNLTGTTNGHGVSATFDVEVSGGTVTGISGNTEGRLYFSGDTLTILGTQIGGVAPADNVVITVTGVTSGSLFYDHYTKQIFERRLGNKRVSFYDEEDILNVDSVYEISGYIPVYSQSLTFPINYASFNFHCDGVFSNNGDTTSQTVNNAQELVTLFNNIFRQFGYFFDNNDGTIGVYINPSLKQQYCPSGTYTINVYND